MTLIITNKGGHGMPIHDRDISYYCCADPIIDRVGSTPRRDDATLRDLDRRIADLYHALAAQRADISQGRQALQTIAATLQAISRRLDATQRGKELP